MKIDYKIIYNSLSRGKPAAWIMDASLLFLTKFQQNIHA